MKRNSAAMRTACNGSSSSGNCAKVKTGLNGVHPGRSRQKDFELLTEYDLFAKTLEKTISEIRYADQGYSGFFDLIKIREAELDSMYELDGEIVEAAGRFNDEFKKLAASPLEHDPGSTPLRERSGADRWPCSSKGSALLKGYRIIRRKK